MPPKSSKSKKGVVERRIEDKSLMGLVNHQRTLEVRYNYPFAYTYR